MAFSEMEVLFSQSFRTLSGCLAEQGLLFLIFAIHAAVVALIFGIGFFLWFYVPLFLFPLYQHHARHRFFDELDICSTGVEVQPHDTWPLRLRFDARRDFTSTGVRVELIGPKERVHQVRRLHGPQSFRSGERFDQTFLIVIPDNLPNVYAGLTAKLIVEIRGRADWSHRTRLKLVPRPEIAVADLTNVLLPAEGLQDTAAAEGLQDTAAEVDDRH